MDTKSYATSLLEELERLWKQQLFCDFRLKTKGSTFKVHRCVLAGMSRFAESILLDNIIEEYEVDWTEDTTETLLGFLYSGELRPKRMDEVTELVEISKMWDLDHLSTACQLWLTHNPNSKETKNKTDPSSVPGPDRFEDDNTMDTSMYQEEEQDCNRSIKHKMSPISDEEPSKHRKIEHVYNASEVSDQEDMYQSDINQYTFAGGHEDSDPTGEQDTKQQFSCQTCNIKLLNAEECLTHVCSNVQSDDSKHSVQFYIKRPSINFKPKNVEDKLVKLMNDRLEKQDHPSFLDTIPKDVSFICVKCKSVFPDQLKCSSHIDKTHCKKEDKGQQSYQCKLCESTPIFKSETVFHIHLLLFHSLPMREDGSPSYWPARKCGNVDKLSKVKFRKKITKKVKQPPAEAEFSKMCDFSQKSEVLIQMRYMLQKCFPYVCNACLIRFDSEQSGYIHAVNEHSFNPDIQNKNQNTKKPMVVHKISSSEMTLHWPKSMPESSNVDIQNWKEGLQSIQISKLVERRIRSCNYPSALDILPVGLCFACSICKQSFISKESCVQHLKEECQRFGHLAKYTDSNSEGAQSTLSQAENQDDQPSTNNTTESENQQACLICRPTVHFKSPECFEIHLLLFHSIPFGQKFVIQMKKSDLTTEELDNLIYNWPPGKQCTTLEDLADNPLAIDEHSYAFSVHELGIPNVINLMTARLERCFLYHCALCLVNFTGITETQNHIIDEHQIEMSSSPVFVMRRVDSMLGRLASQSVKKSPVQLCIVQGCSYKGEAEKNMLYHQYFQHQFDLPEWLPIFMCEICGLAVRTKSKLQDHLNTHSSSRSFLCSQCGYSARTKTTLSRHESTVHTEKNFACGECPYKSKTKKLLEVHLRIHSNYRPFCCQFCTYRSCTKGNLSVHLKNRHAIHKVEEGMKIDNSLGPKPKLDLPYGTKTYQPETTVAEKSKKLKKGKKQQVHEQETQQYPTTLESVENQIDEQEFLESQESIASYSEIYVGDTAQSDIVLKQSNYLDSTQSGYCKPVLENELGYNNGAQVVHIEIQDVISGQIQHHEITPTIVTSTS